MREVLTRRDIQLTKSLGQNFLHDANQLQKMVEAAELSKADKVLEIGPGLGPLTELLLKKAGEVLAIEMDRRLVEVLRERFSNSQFAIRNSQFELLHDDALKFLQNEKRDWQRLETCSEPAIFRRLADFGGTRRRQPRAENDCRHAATGSRQTPDGTGR